MFARVVTGKAQAGKMDEATGIYRDKVIPAAKSQKGFHDATLLTDPATGQFVSFTVWDTEEDMLAGETSGYFNEALAAIVPTLVAPPSTDRYEVAAQS